MNRRRFVQLIAGAVTAVATPTYALGSTWNNKVVDDGIIRLDIPRLLGDGMNDDSPALNALMRGQPVEIGPLVDVSLAGLRGGVFHMPRGMFRLDAPIRFAQGENAYTDVDWRGSVLCPSRKCASVFWVGKPDAEAEPLTIRGATVNHSTWPFTDPSEWPDWTFSKCRPVAV